MFMKKKNHFVWLTFFLAILFIPGNLWSDEQLADLISQKQLSRSATLFKDNSFEAVENYFTAAVSVKFVLYNENKLTYKAKFADYAEIGTLTYNRTGDGETKKYFALEIKNQIKPLYFIETFSRHPVRDMKITSGDAEIFFEYGNLYQSQPYGQVLFFNGKWTFRIKPGDEEERLTLGSQFKSDTFSAAGTWGIFVLENDNREFVNTIQSTGRVKKESGEIAAILSVYKEYFGIQVKQFNEYWYLPFKREDNLVIFANGKKAFYLYDFNSTLNPDTMLRTSINDRIVLSYNSINSPKLSFKETDKIEKISLNLFYNPLSNFLSGTARLHFKNPSPFKILNLDQGLKIKANLDNESAGLSVVRKGNQYYILGPPTAQFSFFYSGKITSLAETSDIFKKQIAGIEVNGLDDFFYLSRTQDFYPNSYVDFAESEISISTEKQFNCLASGQQVKVTDGNGERRVYSFASPNMKGMSLVCGDFTLTRQMPSRIPLNIYGSASAISTKQIKVSLKEDANRVNVGGFEQLSRYFDFKKLQDALDFLLEKFGPLDIPAINLVFKKGLQEGGVSETGLIIYTYNPDQAISRQINRNSPILLSADGTDQLVHELAHQWWGGIISWKSYRDIWLTEGLAQFSVMYYLEHNVPGKKFKKILEQMKKWIFKKNDIGPVIYGRRILTINNDYEAYQSIVYNKAAFILFMLKDMLGEANFLERLRLTKEKLQYTSVTAPLFTRTFSSGSETIERFFEKWITSRKIPAITCQAKIVGKQATISIDQFDSDFVFPLKVKIKTRTGSFTRILVVDKNKQTFEIAADSPIRSVRIDKTRCLVKIKE